MVITVYSNAGLTFVVTIISIGYDSTELNRVIADI